MKILAKKTSLSGNIVVPGSKSHTIRALILASLAEGVSHISNPYCLAWNFNHNVGFNNV